MTVEDEATWCASSHSVVRETRISSPESGLGPATEPGESSSEADREKEMSDKQSPHNSLNSGVLTCTGGNQCIIRLKLVGREIEQ